MGTSWENNDMEESLRKDTVAAEAETGDEENKAPACCCRTKVRTEKEQKDLINRLSSIDIINQVAAANAALNSFTKVLLANHIHTCVTEDVQAGNSEKVDELVKTLQKLMK